MSLAIAPIDPALASSIYGAKEHVSTDVYKPTSLRAPYESWFTLEPLRELLRARPLASRPLRRSRLLGELL